MRDLIVVGGEREGEEWGRGIVLWGRKIVLGEKEREDEEKKRR